MKIILLDTLVLKPASVGFIIFLILPIMSSECILIEKDCILDLNLSQFPKHGAKGTWGGFLTRNCSGEAFYSYIYALAKRAKSNVTRSIFLDSSDQMRCLVSMNEKSENDMLACGIEKLTKGGGGCSDFSVSDVMRKLPRKLTSLKQNCEGTDFACDSCVRSWESIGALEIHSSSFDEVTKAEAHVCRFSVLVSLTSRIIEDQKWIQSVYSCLQDQTSTYGLAENEHDARKLKGRQAILSSIVLMIGVPVLVLVFLVVLLPLRRQYAPNPATGKVAYEYGPENVPDYLRIPREELCAATDDFNEMNLIGEGTAGKVYKGMLQNGHHVAIKHIISEGHTDTFYRELTSLWQIKHPNLVGLLGFCSEVDELFLVYELCVNGDLSKWIFSEEKVLPWTKRLAIAVDIANALKFLHTYPEGSIIHRDIKPTNILLSENLSAKLSDFGLSKVIEQGESFASSEVRGTFGYIDPEYQTNNHVNSSADVYSFGVVLLQLLSGKKVVNMKQSTPKRLDKIAKCPDGEGFADPKLNGEYSAEAFELLLELALTCTGCKKERPSMEEVVKQIQIALTISLLSIPSSIP